MRDFSKISPALWRSKRFSALASSDAGLAHFYFLTCEHQNSAGCYRLPDGYAAADLGWELERYREAREAVVKAGLVLYDPDTSEVLVADWFRFNAPQNDNHAKGIARFLEGIESEHLQDTALAAFEAAETLRASKASQPAREPPARSYPLEGTRYLNGQGRG